MVCDLHTHVVTIRTPPEKPVHCCKKGCVEDFKANKIRLKHLQETLSKTVLLLLDTTLLICVLLNGLGSLQNQKAHP